MPYFNPHTIPLPPDRPDEGDLVTPLPINREWIAVVTGLCYTLLSPGFFEDSADAGQFIAESVAEIQFRLAGSENDTLLLYDDASSLLTDTTGDTLRQ